MHLEGFHRLEPLDGLGGGRGRRIVADDPFAREAADHLLDLLVGRKSLLVPVAPGRALPPRSPACPAGPLSSAQWIALTRTRLNAGI